MENRAAGTLCRLSGCPQTSPSCLSKELLSPHIKRLSTFLWEFINLKEFTLITNGIVLRCISSLMLVLWAGDLENRSSPSSSQQHCMYLFTSNWALCSEVIQSILKSFCFRKLWGTRRKIKLCFSCGCQGCNWLAVKLLWHKSGECSCVTTTQGTSWISFCSVNFQNSRNN